MRGYGSRFHLWALLDNQEPYNRMGSGSAMRISPVGYLANSLEDVMVLAEKSASVTHNHAEGIKGAQAVATSIYLCNHLCTKTELKDYIE